MDKTKGPGNFAGAFGEGKNFIKSQIMIEEQLNLSRILEDREGMKMYPLQLHYRHYRKQNLKV